MEKRIGKSTNLIKGKSPVATVSILLSECGSTFHACQAVYVHHRNISIISLVIEGVTKVNNALSGKYGRLKYVKVKSILTKCREAHNYEQQRT